MNCPVCNGEMYDNTVGKKNPKAPDFRCKDKNCKFALNKKTGEWEPSEYGTGCWLPKGEEIFKGTAPKKILIATGHPNLAQNNNDLKKFILNNATALTIKFQEQSASQQMWLNEADIDEYLDRRIKAIAGMMMGLQI